MTNVGKSSRFFVVVAASAVFAACGGTPQAAPPTVPTAEERPREPAPPSGVVDPPIDAGGARLAEGSDFELEFVSAYYDRLHRAEGGLVARFRFRNKTTSNIRIRGRLMNRFGVVQNDPTKFAVLSLCDGFQIDGRAPTVNGKHASCDREVVELLPGIAYTIDVPVFVPIGENQADRSATVLIAGPDAAIASGPFALRALLDALPSNRRYPANGDLPIAAENRFVMDVAALKKEWALGGERLPKNAYFEPTADEILATNRAILKYLRSPPPAEQRNLLDASEDDRKRIVEFLDQYCVQYWGTIAKGKKTRSVVANFLLCPKRHLENEYPRRSSEIVEVKGGGSDFWCGEFDVTNHTLTSVWVNASR